jgi:hypothetical protein
MADIAVGTAMDNAVDSALLVPYLISAVRMLSCAAAPTPWDRSGSST